MTMTPWHNCDVPDVFAELHSTPDGLEPADARTRLERFGPNTVPSVPPTPAHVILLRQFRSVVVVLLIGAAGVALAIGDAVDASAIGAVLAINVALGFAVEMRARRAVEALAKLEARHATVVRGGVRREVDARDVVPGDVLAIEAGQAIPADARLIDGTEIRVVEAPLTGESAPVSKRPEPLDANTPLPERRNMLYAGTTLAAGSGRAVIVATGAATELGAIGRLVSGIEEEKSPLERRLDALGRQLVWAALGVGILMAVLGALQDQPLALLLQAAIALAVAAVPEGLPAVSTIALALGVRRMARRRALVRRLHSVEALGSVTVICSDKTGTLTAGEMTVTAIWAAGRRFDVTGAGYSPEGTFSLRGEVVRPRDYDALWQTLRIGALVNRADAVLAPQGWIARGDPTEAALIVAARKAGIERRALIEHLPEVAEVPFSSERKLMATFHERSGGVEACVKGAPHRVLDLCALDEPTREAALAQNRDMAARGLRVLALASGPATHLEEAALGRLSFAGLVGMIDPPAPGVEDTIQRFRAAGVSTVMVTGDQRLTAEAIARELGLLDGSPEAASLNGREIDRLSDGELEERVGRVTVFSRISPEAKLRIVKAYQGRGEVVAMLGDGVNDAAALRRADVGVTMGGRGTDVARETAAVVLEDDRFSTIGVAIEEGRVIYDNVRKFIFYLFSCNLAEIVVLFGTTAVGLPLPMQPIQILWLNLVTDTIPALALAVEPAEPDVMCRLPRDPRSGIVSWPFMRAAVLYAGLIALSTFIVIAWSRNADPARTMTLTFTTLGLAQVFHLGNARSRGSVVTPRRAAGNMAALAALVTVVGLQIAAVHLPPLARVLHAAPLSVGDWAIVTLAALIPAVAGQILKITRYGVA